MEDNFDSNIKGLYVNGEPDDFEIFSAGTFVGSCTFWSNHAIPFVIANNKLYIGSRGKSHGSCNHQSETIGGGDIEYGRLWLKVETNPDPEYMDYKGYSEGEINAGIGIPYSILSFWNGDTPNVIDINLVNELFEKYKVDKNKVLVVSFEKDDYGKIYPYIEWNHNTPEASEKQKEARAIHLMNAKNKHNATSDFRTNRDRKIGQKLTNDKGQEMPVAQYRSMIYTESVDPMKGIGYNIYGAPDDFGVYYGDTEIGECYYENDDAFPFIISDGKLYIGSRGGNHGSIFSQILGMEVQEYDRRVDAAIESGDDDELIELRMLWQQANEAIGIDSNSINGRIYLSVYQKADIPFDYTILSFWNDSVKVDGEIINQLLREFDVSPDDVLIAKFEDGEKGTLIPLQMWDYYVPETSQTQKNAYALHLLNAHDKHDATTSFRATRDRNIGKKLTNDKGVEMPVAQYMAMVRSENIKRIVKNVLKEYIDKNTKRIIF